MGRSLRADDPGFVYHVLNRSNARLPLFHQDGDYHAFEGILREAQQRVPMHLLACCLLPNHWHLVLWPEQPRALSRFVGWLTLMHTQRWHAHYHNPGSGHVYPDRERGRGPFPVPTFSGLAGSTTDGP